MSVTPDLVEELNALIHFNLSNTQAGVKVHASANPEVIDAFQRLHDKGLVSQVDGGYLTPLGLEAAEHAEHLLIILSSKTPA